MDVLLISRCPPFPLSRRPADPLPYFAGSCRAPLRDRPARVLRQPGRSGRGAALRAVLPQRDADSRAQPLARELLAARADARQPLPRRAEQSWSPEMWRAIEERLKKRAYDVVHLFGGVQVYEYRRLAAQLPNVIVPYESYSLWLDRAVREARTPFARMAARLRQAMARRYESFMFEGYDRVVVLTDRDAAALKALNPATPTVTIPNGVDVDFFTPSGYEPDEPALLFTGNFDYPPNLDAALRLVRDIFPRVKQVVPEARLYLVGGNPPDALRAYALRMTWRFPAACRTCALFRVLAAVRQPAAARRRNQEQGARNDGDADAGRRHAAKLRRHPREKMGSMCCSPRTMMSLLSGSFLPLRTPSLRARLAQNGRRLVEEQFTGGASRICTKNCTCVSSASGMRNKR